MTLFGSLTSPFVRKYHLTATDAGLSARVAFHATRPERARRLPTGFTPSAFARVDARSYLDFRHDGLNSRGSLDGLAAGYASPTSRPRIAATELPR